MHKDSRLLVISNRLPISLAQVDGEWKTSRSAGGLATAMDPILRREGGVWIGWSGAQEDEAKEAHESLRKDGFITVDLPADIVTKFYEGAANRALWPLFHNFTGRLSFDPDNWKAYHEANRMFCDVVLEQYQPGDRIWVHDYHLMLLPQMIRKALPDAAIGFFLHTPFPSADIFSILPRGEELLLGVLGADLVCFQTHLHLQHFRRSLMRLVGIESSVDRVDIAGREVRIQAIPIGIAPDDFSGHIDDQETQEQLERLRLQYRGRKLIAAVDRLDYTKGLPERLRTYRRLLRTRPELLGKLVLLQVAVPSRENIAAYQELRSEVHELVAGINGEFGTPDWVPVIYIHRGLSRSELVAIYNFADVAWVSPLKDGMNLVAKEYVACHPEGDGVLVLSQFAGSAAEMGEALLTNPFDEERSAEIMARALSMGADEKRDRMLALYKRVKRNDVFAWGERFLRHLAEAVEARSGQVAVSAPALPVTEFLAAYRTASKRLLLIDYDGTLVPFRALPGDAGPTEEVLRLLADLGKDVINTVVVISGRRANDLERWLGQIEHLGLAAEHGARWRLPGSNEWQGHAEGAEWKGTVRPILEHFVDRTPGSFIEEKAFSLVWHFRQVEPEFGEWLATELVAMLEEMLGESEVRAYRGNRVVEVKPNWANKGIRAKELAAGYSEGDFILAIGDDRTDEDMFAQLPTYSWTVHVGLGVSKAVFRLTDSHGVRAVLRQMI